MGADLKIIIIALVTLVFLSIASITNDTLVQVLSVLINVLSLGVYFIDTTVTREV